MSDSIRLLCIDDEPKLLRIAKLFRERDGALLSVLTENLRIFQRKHPDTDQDASIFGRFQVQSKASPDW